jgi:hypothetical protein
VKLAPGVRAGDVATVLFYVAQQLDARVEDGDLYTAGDDWGYSFRPNTNNPSQLSCHASATAFDWNATRHSNGSKGTFSAGQVAEIRRILAEVGGVVRWGGDFTGTKDEMHFEIIGNAAQVKAVADRLRGVAPSPNPQGLPSLTMGMTHPLVGQAQKYFNKNFPRYSKLVVDNIYGKATRDVVKTFQHGTPYPITTSDADGTIIGPKTWAKMIKLGFKVQG